MPRYVILQHAMPPHAGRPTHWDLMLESGAALATWALETPPAAGREVAGHRLADHRAHFLDYEGPLSGDRGTVTRWDAGQYTLESQSPDCWVVTLHGSRLSGRLVLRAAAEPPAAQWVARLSPLSAS